MNTLRYCNIKSLNNILSRHRNQTVGYVITGFECAFSCKGETVYLLLSDSIARITCQKVAYTLPASDRIAQTFGKGKRKFPQSEDHTNQVTSHAHRHYSKEPVGSQSGKRSAIQTALDCVNRLPYGHQRHYSKKKDSCCKEISQTEGRTVEPWPKTQMWPCNFPNDPQPPNYDPYKIRSPDVVVPPLPPSNVKRTGFVYMTSNQQQGPARDYRQAHPYYESQSDEVKSDEEYAKQEEEGSQGFFGYLKNMLGWGKKGRREGDVSMIDEAPIAAKSEKFSLEEGRALDMPSTAIKNLFQKTHMVHPDNWKSKSLSQMQKLDRQFSQENTPRLGYHGRDKYKYAFHEPWNPLDRLTLLAQAERDESPVKHVTTYDANKGAT